MAEDKREVNEVFDSGHGAYKEHQVKLQSSGFLAIRSLCFAPSVTIESQHVID